MEFDQILARRRMSRRYADRPVPAELLDRVVSVAARAPSAGNCKPHRLVVVTDPQTRAAMAAVAEPYYLRLGLAPWISQAPVQIALGIREASYRERYAQADKLNPDGTEIGWPVPFWWFDAGALFMLMHLAAIDAGLATGFYSPADPGELAALARIVALPGDVALCGVLTVGWATP